MKTIKKSRLRFWLTAYITECIHSMRTSELPEFNKWAKSFDKKDANFVVNLEFINDWGYDERELIPLDEAANYANKLMQRIVNSWYL